MFLRNAYGSGSGQIWLDQVDCNGSELSLADCRHAGWAAHDCSHHEDVSIICGKRNNSSNYSAPIVQSVGASRSRCGLRSSSTSSLDYCLPRLRTKFGEWAFSHAGPATWNALPDHIRTVADLAKFRKLLKSHYFSQAFNIC